MVLLRIAVERLLALVFGLVATVALVQSLAVLISVLGAMALPVRAATPSWAIQPLVLGALLCATLMAGGILLVVIQARSRSKASWGRADDSLETPWLLAAMVPTLVIPAITLFQSQPLIQLWRDVFAATERFGGLAGLMKSDGAGLLLLPALMVLFVPLLEAATAFFLIAVPPLLLALLLVRSSRFRMEAQRLVVIQWTLVGASMLGAALFGQLIELATPHIKAAGEREGALVLVALARGRQVLTGTAMAYTAVVLANASSLWVLTAALRRKEASPGAVESLPSLSSPLKLEDSPHVPAEPAPPPEAFEDVLARYRARYARRS